MICNGKMKLTSGLTEADKITIHDFLPFPTSVFEIYMNELGKIEEAKKIWKELLLKYPDDKRILYSLELLEKEKIK